MLNGNAKASGKVVPIVRCSFCGCGHDHEGVEVLLASKLPGVYICQGCVALSISTLVKHDPSHRAKLGKLLRTRVSPSRAPS